MNRKYVTVVMKMYRPQKSGDVDNFIKVTLDSIQGIAIENDTQVVRIVAERFDDKADPRVVVAVFPYRPLGDEK